MSETCETLAIELYHSDRIQACNWQPRLFWRADPETGNAFASPRVDPCELALFFAALLGQERESPAIEHLSAARSRFLIANARRHELPLFTPQL